MPLPPPDRFRREFLVRRMTLRSQMLLLSMHEGVPAPALRLRLLKQLCEYHDPPTTVATASSAGLQPLPGSARASSSRG